jgi:hypothetical protein
VNAVTDAVGGGAVGLVRGADVLWRGNEATAPTVEDYMDSSRSPAARSTAIAPPSGSNPPSAKAPTGPVASVAGGEFQGPPLPTLDDMGEARDRGTPDNAIYKGAIVRRPDASVVFSPAAIQRIAHDPNAGRSPDQIERPGLPREASAVLNRMAMNDWKDFNDRIAANYARMKSGDMPGLQGATPVIGKRERIARAKVAGALAQQAAQQQGAVNLKAQEGRDALALADVNLKAGAVQKEADRKNALEIARLRGKSADLPEGKKLEHERLMKQLEVTPPTMDDGETPNPEYHRLIRKLDAIENPVTATLADRASADVKDDAARRNAAGRVLVKSQQEYDALPVGTPIIDAQGITGTKK